MGISKILSQKKSGTWSLEGNQFSETLSLFSIHFLDFEILLEISYEMWGKKFFISTFFSQNKFCE